MLVTTCPTHTRILTELPSKLNLKLNCESLLLGTLSGMSCESAEWTRWSLEIEIQMDDRNGEMEAKAGPGDCFVLGLAYRCYMVWLSASKPG